MGIDLVGRVLLNRYRVTKFMAAGAMGAVYRVQDLKRSAPLAMKVLHEDLADDPSIYKRFKRGANALKKLDHPRIVPFYGIYSTEGVAFQLLGYIDGPTLKQIIRQQKGKILPMKEALAYMKAVSSALGYAHFNGVVHCDVKPGNVLVDRGGSVYLTDFDIARHAESTTTTLGFAGTAAYMAPEQCRGEAVTAQTDVYALGVMLYEMLAGRRPFLGDEEEAERGGSTGSERVRYAHIHMAPPDPLSINPGLPEELGEVLLKALAKEPTDRYYSVQEFFQAACNAVGVLPGEVPGRVHVEEELIRWSSDDVDAQREYGVSYPAPAIPRGNSIPEKVRQWLSKQEKPQILVFAGFFAILAIGLFSIIDGPIQPTPTPTATVTIETVLLTVGSTKTSTVITTTQTPHKATPAESDVPLTDWRQGKLAFVAITTGQQSLYSMDLESDDPQKPLTLPPSNRYYLAPSWSPDGTRIALSDYLTKMLIVDETTGQIIVTTDPCNSPTWAPDGNRIICKRSGEFLLDIVDAETGEILQTLSSSRSGLVPAWSPNGIEIAFSTKMGGDKSIIWRVSLSGGQPIMLASDGTENYAPAWSPDGQRIAYQSNQGSSNSEIWIMDRDGQNATRITYTNEGWSRGPTWSPDGNWIAFVSSQTKSSGDDYGEIFVISVDGVEINRITDTGGHVYDWRVSWTN